MAISRGLRFGHICFLLRIKMGEKKGKLRNSVLDLT